MAVLPWVLIALFGWLAVIDVHDRRRKRRRRSIDQMMVRRQDELAEIWGTQHSGIAIPIDHIGKDRGVPGERR